MTETKAPVWAGSTALRELLVPIDSLSPHPDNPRRGDVEAIKQSLTRFGQVRPVLIDADGSIIAGNHTWKAAKELGWEEIAANRNEFANADEARAYLLADNRLAELGEYDRAELRTLLEELESSGGWEGTGYAARDLEDLRALAEMDDAALNPPPAPPPGGDWEPSELREVVMQLTPEQHASLGEHVRFLRTEYGLEGVTETILRAVHEEAERIDREWEQDGD